MGVANKNSIAAGIAESMNDFGAEIALSYQFHHFGLASCD